MSTYYSLRVIRLDELKWKHPLHSGMPDLYAKIRLGDIEWKTTTFKKSASPAWNEIFVIPPSDESSELMIEVKHNSTLLSNRCVGHVGIDLGALLARCANGEATLELSSSSSSESSASGLIVVHLTVITSSEAVRLGLEGAQAGLERRGFVRSTKASSISQSIGDWIAGFSSQGDFYQAFGELLRRLEVFKNVMDVVSEIHPFVTIAWTLASGLYQLVDRTFKVDKKVLHLVSAMVDAFSSVRDVQSLRDKYLRLQGPITGLLKQIIECCIFVRHYTSRSFTRRMLDANSSQKIDEFEQILASFKQQLDSGVIRETALVLVRTAGRIDTMYLRGQLNPGMFDAFDRSICLPGTRLGIRQQIIEWMSSETSQNILWLFGIAGSGKSTVSSTIASHFKQISRLGAFLFFVREKSDPSSVVRTIAYQLALFDSTIGERILSEIDRDKGIGMASSADQFNNLLLDPLESLAETIPGPIVVVLDALDECGTPESRIPLMDLLRTEFRRLPTNFRFLITSRREHDIDRFLSSELENVATVQLDHASITSQNDVLCFLGTEMRNVLRGQVDVPEGWPWDESMKLLGKAAGGLFIWASTAVKMVRNSDEPFYQLESLVTDSRSVSGFGLNELYSTVLRNSGISWKEERSRDRFKRVMSLLLLIKVPVSTEAIDGFLGLSAQQSSSQVLSRLRSLVSYSPGGSTSLLHASFSDYLTSPDHSSDPWFIDMVASQNYIIERCFAIMEKELRFNICNLQSSSILNDDIPDLASRIKSRIPPHLEYACLHLYQHLIDVPYSTELLKMLSDFVHQRLLFWFEVLSLTKTFGRVATQALSHMARWSEPHDTNMTSFLRDAKKLASMFGLPIVQSAPHIYVSMIPFSKADSEVANHYSKFMVSFIQVERIGVKQPPLCLKVFEKRWDDVASVAFSPNGRHIASVTRDESVRVRDIDSGDEILPPLIGRTVCFSPNGEHILSGGHDGIRMWDARNGDLILGPLRGNTEYRVESVAWSPDGTMIASLSGRTITVRDATNGEVKFIFTVMGYGCVAFSPDSTRLASGCDDIRIWNVKSGKLAFGPFGEGVKIVAFSPDGKHVVSGSGDRTVEIWEVESGKVISIFKGHIGIVMSVAYSPCGTRIVSGSWDSTIRVWDSQSGQIISTLEGHTNIVYSVAYSLDGKYIASGSRDETVRIWDASAVTGNSKAPTKHLDVISSVAYSSSPDGTRIASASDDNSIIVWDAQTGNVTLGPLLGHTDRVKCVAFLPDGTRLLSGSWDNTIRIWDTETGESVSEPLVHTHLVNCIAISPDGTTVASGSDSLRVWSIGTGRLVSGSLHYGSYYPYPIIFTPDGKRLASGSNDGTIEIWDTATWRTIFDPSTGHTNRISSLYFSSDGTRLVSGSLDGSIIIWDAENGRKVTGPLRGHAGYVSSVVFSLDRKYVVSGSWDNTIRVWDVESGQTISKLEGHTFGVNSLSLSPDGCRIVSGSIDNTIRMWDLSDILQPSVENAGVATPLSLEWVLGKDGWILGGQDRRELLAWVPPDLRRTLLWPHNTAILSCEYSTKLDFTGAAIGKRWTECFSPPLKSVS